MALIILAGGRGTRLGRDKSQLELGGRRVVSALMSQLGFAGETIISSADPDGFSGLPVRVVADAPGQAGPLAGIAAGLRASHDSANLFVACDMPFPAPGLARDLLSAVDHGHDAAVPCPGGWPEPAFAAYSRRCLSAIEQRLVAGQLKVTGFYEDVQTLRLDDGQIGHYGPPDIIFLNINTESDLHRAELLIPQARELGCWPH